MGFNFKTGLVNEREFDCWRADGWLHFNLTCGMISVYMTKETILEFISFLRQIKETDKQSFKNLNKKFQDYYEEEICFTVEDNGECCNIHIGTGASLIIFVIGFDDIDNFIQYLEDNKEGAE